MQLIIKEGYIFATHEDAQDIAHLYPGYECIQWDEHIEFLSPEEGPTTDPRNVQQKKDKYKDKRRVAYPNIIDQLEMIYNDKKNGTNTFVEAIDGVKIIFPKEVI